MKNWPKFERRERERWIEDLILEFVEWKIYSRKIQQFSLQNLAKCFP
jgi:hypothetical protein